MSEVRATLPGLTPEADLLKAAVAVGDPARRATRIAELLAQELDWAYLSRTALRNRIIPLFYRAVRHSLNGQAGSEPVHQLEQDYRLVQFLSLTGLQEMLDLVRLFESHGIETVPYKGPVLAATLYDEISQRQYSDLDVFVRKQALPRADELLRARGYRLRPGPRARDFESTVATDCHLHYESGEATLPIEVHWEFLPPHQNTRFFMEEYWDRLVPVTVAGAHLQAFAPEDLLVVLCAHGGDKHRWLRLQLLADVARLLATNRDLDWGHVLDRTGTTEARRTLLLGVLVAHLMLDAPLPDSIVQRAVTDPAVTTDVGMTWGRPFAERPSLPGLREWRTNMHHAFAGITRSGATRGPATGFLRYLHHALKPSWHDRELIALPRRFMFLSYVHRPLRLLCDGAARALARGRGRPDAGEQPDAANSLGSPLRERKTSHGNPSDETSDE